MLRDKDEYPFVPAEKDVKVYSCPNHEIVLSDNIVLIYTLEGQNYLADGVSQVINLLKNYIFSNNQIRIRQLTYDVNYEDYLEDSEELKEISKDVKIDCDLTQEYNIKREKKSDYNMKNEVIENFKSQYISSYFTDNGISHYKEIAYSTAEYYNKIVGKLTTKIETFILVTTEGNNFISGNELNLEIDKLRTKASELFKESFTEKYFKIW